jgi:hypothetical protein
LAVFYAFYEQTLARFFRAHYRFSLLPGGPDEGGRPETLDVPKTSRAGFLVNTTWVAVAAAEIAEVPDTSAASRIAAVATFDAP